MPVSPALAGLGPAGPFPRAALADPLERRWLHYAFFSRDGARSMIANLAWLGAPAGEPGFQTAVLLTHDRDGGWSCSQWNASFGDDAPWSSFALDHASNHFELGAAKQAPHVRLQLRRSSTPCVSQCASFHGDHWMRWQSEPGIDAEGVWDTGHGPATRHQAVGYHERVRGRWGWPQMGGWVFGFCNSLGHCGHAPAWSIVFTLLQPHASPSDYASSVMLWRRGRHLRYFPRAGLRVSVAGQLERDRVVTVPHLASLFGTAATVPIPAALAIDGQQGHDQVALRFVAREAARLVIPSETSFAPYSVHEVIGHVDVELEIDGRQHRFDGPAVVEFAGGASRGGAHVH